jgi:hypothetical protein
MNKLFYRLGVRVRLRVKLDSEYETVKLSKNKLFIEGLSYTEE